MANTPLSQLTSANQGDKTTLWSALQFMNRQQSLNTDGMIPASISSYDRKENLATVTPLIQFVAVDGSTISRQPLVEIPVLALGGGGFVLNFPISEGDLGWIFAADRDLSLFKQSLSETKPNTGRIKQFSDGLWIPDVFRKYVINAEDEGCVVLQATDGSSRISLNESRVKITSQAVIVDTPMATFTKDVNVKGNLVVEGKTNADGGFESKSGTECTLPANATVGGINITTHGHEQQNNGSGRTAGGMTE